MVSEDPKQMDAEGAQTTGLEDPGQADAEGVQAAKTEALSEGDAEGVRAMELGTLVPTETEANTVEETGPQRAGSPLRTSEDSGVVGSEWLLEGGE
ncbi:hypothetical protein GUJ93_ZPchr0006g44388 [Zizania palustris]|uniref:Uncharacterized protein n=1 Tax=Zizania palustris TaxID=103762 RepID=A0A8J5SRH8_ZIZPA|nr:hypothetical protein GUJ93_ZPchr0006g44388 [Zizania palustris]